MSQFWNQLKDRVQAREAQASSTIDIIGGADGPTAVFVSTKPDSWLGTLLGLLPWGTGIISAGLLLGWCHKDKKRLLLPMILSTVGCAVGAEQAAVQAAAVWQAAAAAHPELHPCAAPYNKSRSIPAKRLWKHAGYFLKKRLVATN